MNKAFYDLRDHMNELEISNRYIDGIVILDLQGSLIIGETSDKLSSMLKHLHSKIKNVFSSILRVSQY